MESNTVLSFAFNVGISGMVTPPKQRLEPAVAGPPGEGVGVGEVGRGGGMVVGGALGGFPPPPQPE